jgi:UBX domain-containing protein 1
MGYHRGSRTASTRESARTGPFFGSGHTLGSDEAESQVIPDPNADEDEVDTAVRSIIFWRTGFTIENGPLLLYTDPDSAKLLESIQQGSMSLAMVLTSQLTGIVGSHPQKHST